MSVYVIFNNIPSASGGFAPRPPPGSAPGPRWGTSDPCPPLAKIPAGAHGAPTFFSEQGPVLSKPGPVPTYVILIHQRHWRWQTDGRTTCDRKTALCTMVHRVVKICSSLSGTANTERCCVCVDSNTISPTMRRGHKDSSRPPVNVSSASSTVTLQDIKGVLRSVVGAATELQGQ